MEYTCVKDEAVVYKMKAGKPGWGWANITIREWEGGGSVDIQSDFGAYAYSWGAIGSGTFRAFLRGLNYGYFMGKAAANRGRQFSWEESWALRVGGPDLLWAFCGGHRGGWRVGTIGCDPILDGAETGQAGVKAASLALLRSRPVWRTPMGFDLILGRWPTDAEAALHDDGAGLWRVAERGGRYTGRWMAQARDMQDTPPTLAYPLRLDGLPGIILK